MCLGAAASSVLAEQGEREDGGRPDRGKHPDHEAGERDGKHGRPPFRGGEMFKRMDEDGDGLITKEEFFASPRLTRLPEKKREEIFARLDSDGNGSLDKREIHRIRKDDEKRAREFRELDADASGGLSFAEFSQGKFFKKLPEEKRREIFRRLDTDGDGEVSPKDKPERPRRREKRD